MEHLVYWLHHSHHVDPEQEGYIGITKDLERRKYEYYNQRKHNRKLQEAFEKEVIMTPIFRGTKEECRRMESELRPISMIGWNIAPGGMIPPDVTGRVDSEETKLKKSLNNVGFRGRKHSEETRQKMSKSHKGQVPHNRKMTHTPFGIFVSATEAAKAISINVDTLIYRIKSKSIQFSDYYYIHTERKDKDE